MTPQEFDALCAVWDLPDAWLAPNVGHVSKRTWKYWRTGRAGKRLTVPQDAVQSMKMLNSALESWSDAVGEMWIEAQKTQ